MNEFNNCCRTCLSKEHEMRNLNSVILMSGSEVKLSDILEIFFEYKVDPNDGFPQNICMHCCVLLTNTYSFNLVINSSKQKLIHKSDEGILEDDTDPMCENDTYDGNKFDKFDVQSIVKQDSGSITDLNNEESTNNDYQDLFCTECPCVFSSNAELYMHSSDKHPVSDTLNHKCSYCIQTFSDYHSQMFHQKKHIYKFVCKECWQGFNDEVCFRSHDCKEPQKRNKSNSDVVYRQCHHCGKSYPSGYIRIHMLTHSENTRYACPYCPKRFKVPCSLNSHVAWNHKKMRNHKCEECGAFFVTASARSTHFRKRHLNEKKHMCETCGKKFFSVSQIKRHFLTHTGVKAFHCEMCDKSYQTKYGLTVHMKTHTQTFSM